MRSRLIVFLGILCHLHCSSTHTEEEEEKYIVIEPEEMKGHIKIPDKPCAGEECLYYIDPLANHSVSLHFEGIHGVYENSPNVFYYSGIDIYEKDMVFLGSLERLKLQNLWKSPMDYGFYMNMTGVKHVYGEKMVLHYTRNPAVDQETIQKNWLDLDSNQCDLYFPDKSDICPSPILFAKKTPTQILPKPFGCGYRVHVPDDHLLTLVLNCSKGEVEFDSRFVIENGPSVDLNREDLWGSYNQGYKNHWGANGHWDVIPYDFDMIYYSKREDDKIFCPFTYFALEEDPCHCSSRAYSLPDNETVTLTSPGYPSLLCPRAVCEYNLTAEATRGSDSKNSFVIKTTHLPQDEGDVLLFAIDGEVVELEKLGNNHMNLLTGNSLRVQYRASSVISLKHGFEMTIETIETPLDCLCPSNKPKRLDGGSFSMNIPAHCPSMFCRYHIPNPDRRNVERVLHFEINYTLQHSKEVLILLAGNETHAFYHPVPGKMYDSLEEEFQIKDGVVLTYVRDVTGSSQAESAFNLTWKWVTDGDCTCNESVLTAGRIWKSLYSPGYPGEYCNNMNCTYSIQAPDFQHVQIAVLSFETEPHSDFLTLFEGNRTLKRLDGRKKERISLETVGALASLQFTTDHSITDRGFKIMYMAIPDPGFSPEESPSHVFLNLLAILVLLSVIFILGYKKLLCFKFLHGKVDNFENPTFGYSASENLVVEKN